MEQYSSGLLDDFGKWWSDHHEWGSVEARQQCTTSLAFFARIVWHLGSPYRIVNFLSVDRHVPRSVETKTNFVTSDIDHRNDDIVVDDDALVPLPR